MSKGYDPHWGHVTNPHGGHPRNSGKRPAPPRPPAGHAPMNDEPEQDTGPDSELPPMPTPGPARGF